jgi:hypothetical protein
MRPSSMVRRVAASSRFAKAVSSARLSNSPRFARAPDHAKISATGFVLV